MGSHYLCAVLLAAAVGLAEDYFRSSLFERRAQTMRTPAVCVREKDGAAAERIKIPHSTPRAYYSLLLTKLHAVVVVVA